MRFPSAHCQSLTALRNESYGGKLQAALRTILSFAWAFSLASVNLHVVDGGEANGPCVQFDTESLVAAVAVQSCELNCDPPTPGRTVTTTHERLVEITIGVSTLLRFGQEHQIQQLLFVIENPARTMSVIDFAPRTEMTTSYAGNIERTRQQDHTTSAGLNATLSPVDFATAQANATTGAKNSESVHYQTLPPLELLAASGTAARGSAVYFKFRATPQSTLEGHRDLRVVLRVPNAWRGDYVYLRCAAFDQTALKSNSGPICGSSDFLVPIYLSGDEEARAAAIQLGNSEARLRSVSRSTPVRIAGDKDPSWSDKVNRFLHVSRKPLAEVPRQWLSTVLTSIPERREFSFQTHLPDSVQQAVREFVESRWQLAQLNQTSPTDVLESVAKHDMN